MLLLLLLLLASLTALARAQNCPNSCSKQGTCGPSSECTCFTGFSGPDCSKRTQKAQTLLYETCTHTHQQLTVCPLPLLLQQVSARQAQPGLPRPRLPTMPTFPLSAPQQDFATRIPANAPALKALKAMHASAVRTSSVHTKQRQ